MTLFIQSNFASETGFHLPVCFQKCFEVAQQVDIDEVFDTTRLRLEPIGLLGAVPVFLTDPQGRMFF